MSINIAAEEFFDNVAANYDNLLQDPRFNAQHLNEAAKIFNRHNHAQGTILDIGCGTGALRELLQGDFQYTGIDISSEMLHFAAQRGYHTIHQPIETALAEIDNQSYDFVFCPGALLHVEDAVTAIEHMYRIARQTILISLDEITDEYLQNKVIPTYNHSKLPIKDVTEDYFITGWTSYSVGVTIRTRMIYIELA